MGNWRVQHVSTPRTENLWLGTFWCDFLIFVVVAEIAVVDLAWARFTLIFGNPVKVLETEHTSTGYKQIHNARNRVPVNHTGNGKTQQWRRLRRACELGCVTQAARSMQCYMYARHTLTLYRLSRLIVDYRSRTMCRPCNASCCSCILTYDLRWEQIQSRSMIRTAYAGRWTIRCFPTASLNAHAGPDAPDFQLSKCHSRTLQFTYTVLIRVYR